MDEEFKQLLKYAGNQQVPVIPEAESNVPLPDLDICKPAIPDQEEINSYRSAGELLKRLAQTIKAWRSQLPKDVQPAIAAILPGGMRIRVKRLAQESFHGIRIEGLIGTSPCMLLTHQQSVQLLCYVEKVKKEDDRRTIGFIVDGEETQE